MAEYATIAGLKETVAALRALPAEFASSRGGPVRSALFAAAKPMRDEAMRLAPVQTGNLRANVYVYRDRNPKASTGATERYVIGVRQKRRKYARTQLNRRLGRIGKTFALRGDAYYWWFVEFGTEKMPDQKFMRPAFESGKASAVSTFAEQLRRGVESAVRRAAKR